MKRAQLVYFSAKSLLNREGSSIINRFRKSFRHSFFLLIVFLLTVGSVFSQADQQAYLKTITDRSVKIVNTLSIKDSVVYNKVVSLLVGQYSGLNKIQENNTATVATIKQATATEAEIAARLKNAEEMKVADLHLLHQTFISSLQQLLSPGQVDLVKDGMTYRVFPITYAAYQDMIPTLTEVQKTKIYDWLKEAREIAMDAETSDKKHAVFGKYKGRINNYLSAEGYDLKKATEEWQQRIKERNNPAQP
jgi:Protein of unknown function (DUF3826)